MKPIIVLSAALLLGACSSPIAMRNPDTGQTAQCGPYASVGVGGLHLAEREQQCVTDYHRQGFERIP